MKAIEWVLTNWETILVIVVAAVAAAVVIVKFLKLTPKQQLSRVQLVLLDLVTEAERTLGTKTGKIKRAAVYSAIVKKFPLLSTIISEATYDRLLDDTLAQFRTLLETNDVLYEYVYGKKRGEDEAENIAKTYESLSGEDVTTLLASSVESLNIKEE